MNRWNIPAWLEFLCIERDSSCIYCGHDFSLAPTSRGQNPSWEHIVNDARIINPENIARCCMSCNASKGAKDLLTWLDSPYCKKKGIREDTVSVTVKNAISKSRGKASL